LILPPFFLEGPRQAGIDASTSRTHRLTRRTAGWDDDSSTEDGLHAACPHAQTHRARHGRVRVAGGKALAAEGQVPAGEEHHGRRPQAAAEARAVRRAAGAARVHVRRRRGLRGARGEVLGRRPRRGRGLLELRVQGDRGGLLGEGLRLPRPRLAAEAHQPLLQLVAEPRHTLRLRRLIAEKARRGLVGLEQNRAVVVPQPIGHRSQELLALAMRRTSGAGSTRELDW
jgi:hypothetical protein